MALSKDAQLFADKLYSQRLRDIEDQQKKRREFLFMGLVHRSDAEPRMGKYALIDEEIETNRKKAQLKAAVLLDAYEGDQIGLSEELLNAIMLQVDRLLESLNSYALIEEEQYLGNLKNQSRINEAEYKERFDEALRRLTGSWNTIREPIRNDLELKMAKARLEQKGNLESGTFSEIGARDDERQFMEMAIEEARKSQAEDERSHPKVGAVVVKNGRVLAKSHRGEFPGCHAEYAALEKKLANESLAGATVYTTLEPCTTRNHSKVPCASRLIERKVTRVVIGMLDPNPKICGRGQRARRKARIATDFFFDDLMDQIEELNREFTRHQEQVQNLIVQNQHAMDMQLPTMWPKIRPASYGLQSEKTTRAGLMIANDGGPAYDISIPDVQVGRFTVQMNPHLARLTKEDGKQFCEISIWNPKGTLLFGDALLSVMHSEEVSGVTFTIRFRDSDGCWYVTTCELELEARMKGGISNLGIVARFVKQELERID